MIKWFFVCMLGLLGAKDGSVLSIGNNEYSLHQFYAHYPKKQWGRLDSTKRVEVFNNFIKRNLCILEAKRLELEKDPDGPFIKVLREEWYELTYGMDEKDRNLTYQG